MIPLGDDVPTRRSPLVTYALLGAIGAAWIALQGAGFDAYRLASSVCDLGLVAGEITGKARVGTGVAIGRNLACVVDADPVNFVTPLSSMFLHGSWAHLLGNALFLWTFGRNVEDAMGRLRFLSFYVVCGLFAAAAQVATDLASPVPMVGASGAISGVLGAYLILHPRARVKMLFIFFILIRVILLPAWLVLLYWFGLQLLAALPELVGFQEAVSNGVAVMAHIGGFVAGLALVKIFENRSLRRRGWSRQRA